MERVSRRPESPPRNADQFQSEMVLQGFAANRISLPGSLQRPSLPLAPAIVLSPACGNRVGATARTRVAGLTS